MRAKARQKVGKLASYLMNCIINYRWDVEIIEEKRQMTHIPICLSNFIPISSTHRADTEGVASTDPHPHH
jgi:hypothetical protein